MSTHSTQDEKLHESEQADAEQTAADKEHDIDGANDAAELPDRPLLAGKQLDLPKSGTSSLKDAEAENTAAAAHPAALSDSMPADEHNHEGDGELPYPEPTTTFLHPPDFRPLFTLIEDPATDSHHHPTVHYLFSDDDPEILTAAALETLSDEQHEIEERFVVVDMSANGKEVVATSSFSPEWQVVGTKVTQAPSWGDQTRAADRGLMLRIEGQENGSGNRARKKGDVDGLLKMFDKAMGGLDEALGGKTAQESSERASQ